MPDREQEVQRPEEAAGEVGVGLECLNSKEASVMKTEQGLTEGLGATRELWTLLWVA